MKGVKELEQILYEQKLQKLRLFGPVYEKLSIPTTDRRVSREDLYNLMNGGSGMVYQQRQPRRPKTLEEAEREIEYLKQYGPAFIGAIGGTTVGLSYATGATLLSTVALGLTGLGLGILILGGLGIGLYHLLYKGRRETDPKYPLVRKRSVLYALLDSLEKLWKEGSPQPRG